MMMMRNNHLNAEHLLVYFTCVISFITDREERYYDCSHLMVQEIKWFGELPILIKLVSCEAWGKSMSVGFLKS